MMKEKEEFERIRAIFSWTDLIDIHEKHGSRFRFPIYMTETMSETDIEVLDLGVRSYNCLKRAGIHTIGQLCEQVQGSADLKRIRNLGKTSASEIMDHLFAYQYQVLSPGKRRKFLERVILMNYKDE